MENFENWMPEGTIQKVVSLSDNQTRKADIIYTDILPRDIELYVNLPDEECHKLESVMVNGEQRYNVLIWYKEDQPSGVNLPTKCIICGSEYFEDNGIDQIKYPTICFNGNSKLICEECSIDYEETKSGV